MTMIPGSSTESCRKSRDIVRGLPLRWVVAAEAGAAVALAVATTRQEAEVVAAGMATTPEVAATAELPVAAAA